MAELFDINLETDLSEFDSTVTDGGDLSQSGAAALAGTSGGLSCLIDDANGIYGQCNVANETELRYRIYFNPNGLTMADYDNFHLINENNYDYLLRFKRLSGKYYIYGRVMTDGGLVSTPDIEISDAAHCIEVHMKRSSAPGADDGFIKIWVDQSVPYGAADAEATGLDDDTCDYDEFRIGAVEGIDAGTSGTIYFDEIIIRNDGSEIGPVVGGVAVQADYYRRRRD